jgi:hypothetical protein
MMGLLLFNLDMPDLKGEDYDLRILCTLGWCLDLKYLDG